MAYETLTLPNENPSWIENGESVNSDVTNRPPKHIHENVLFLRDKLKVVINNSSGSGNIGVGGGSFVDKENDINANVDFPLPTGVTVNTRTQTLVIKNLNTGQVFYPDTGFTLMNSRTVRFFTNITAPVNLQFSVFDKKASKFEKILTSDLNVGSSFDIPNDINYIPDVRDLSVFIDGILVDKRCYTISNSSITFKFNVSSKRTITLLVA